jgi:hypothetical protein
MHKRLKFLDVSICSLVELDRRFGRNYFIHLHGQRINQAKPEWPTLGPSKWRQSLETSVNSYQTTQNHNTEDS